METCTAFLMSQIQFEIPPRTAGQQSRFWQMGYLDLYDSGGNCNGQMCKDISVVWPINF